MSWCDAYRSRPEHIFVGAKDTWQTEVVASLKAGAFWAHEQTTESGDEIQRIYSTQRRRYESDPGAKNQPRLFLTDRQWWLYSPRFHYVSAHLVAEIGFPETVLEQCLPERNIDWLYRYGSDARGRLLPRLAKAIAGSDAGSDMMASRIEGAKYLEEVYGELVPAMVYCIPQYDNFPPGALLRMPRASFESRLRSFRMKYEFPDKLTAQNMTEYLVALGIAEHTHNYYLRFATPFAAGLLHLKNQLTHDAIRARLKEKG